jgi:hypothetical protein
MEGRIDQQDTCLPASTGNVKSKLRPERTSVRLPQSITEMIEAVPRIGYSAQ